MKPIMLVLCPAALAVEVFAISDHRVRKRGFAERTACVGNLVRIRLAKESCANEHGSTNGASIPEDSILREAGIAHHCPSGGRYLVHRPGEGPTLATQTLFSGVANFGGMFIPNENAA
ncbi:MAG TPA: hypothetical protein PKE47_04085 [Verrucomicrobiota bacterium]|nr:hypothetical protein [Verrucomicrobiota bacterium]